MKISTIVGYGALLVIVSLMLMCTFNVRQTFITEGDAHGVEIGFSKKEVFDRLKARYKKEKLTYRKSPDVEWGEEVALTFSKSDWEYLKKKDRWRLCYGSLNFMEYIFKDDTLSTFRKHRQFFEVP